MSRVYNIASEYPVLFYYTLAPRDQRVTYPLLSGPLIGKDLVLQAAYRLEVRRPFFSYAYYRRLTGFAESFATATLNAFCVPVRDD